MMKTHKLFVAVIGVAFVLGAVVALADDKTPNPVTKEDTAKSKAERDAAKAANAKLTPEEKQAAKQAKSKQKQKQLSQEISVGNIPSGPQKAEAITTNAQATKSDPKPLPDAKSKQEALKQQTNKPTGQ
jgi:hypothetical protein